MEGYSDSLRRELLCHGIPVIKLQPGSFKTALTGEIHRQFANSLKETVYYKKVLSGMQPMMEHELTNAADPQNVAKVLIKAVTAPRPRIKYRVGTSKKLLFLEILPEKWVDFIYGRMFRRYQ